MRTLLLASVSIMLVGCAAKPMPSCGSPEAQGNLQSMIFDEALRLASAPDLVPELTHPERIKKELDDLERNGAIQIQVPVLAGYDKKINQEDCQAEVYFYMLSSDNNATARSSAANITGINYPDDLLEPGSHIPIRYSFQPRTDGKGSVITLESIDVPAQSELLLAINRVVMKDGRVTRSH